MIPLSVMNRMQLELRISESENLIHHCQRLGFYEFVPAIRFHITEVRKEMLQRGDTVSLYELGKVSLK